MNITTHFPKLVYEYTLTSKRNEAWPTYRWTAQHPWKWNKHGWFVLLVTLNYYSALGPVWAETRAQSVNWYSSGKLHPGQVLRGSLPLLSPAFRRSHFRHQVPQRPRDPSGRRWNCGRECFPVILPKWRLPRHLGIFYMPQIYDMGPTALLPLRRKVCWGFFFWVRKCNVTLN